MAAQNCGLSSCAASPNTTKISSLICSASQVIHSQERLMSTLLLSYTEPGPMGKQHSYKYSLEFLEIMDLLLEWRHFQNLRWSVTQLRSQDFEVRVWFAPKKPRLGRVGTKAVLSD